MSSGSSGNSRHVERDEGQESLGGRVSLPLLYASPQDPGRPTWTRESGRRDRRNGYLEVWGILTSFDSRVRQVGGVEFVPLPPIPTMYSLGPKVPPDQSKDGTK